MGRKKSGGGNEGKVEAAVLDEDAKAQLRMWQESSGGRPILGAPPQAQRSAPSAPPKKTPKPVVEPAPEPAHFEWKPFGHDVQELVDAFDIYHTTARALNDALSAREATRHADIKKIWDVLETTEGDIAHVLDCLIRDMNYGKFVGQADCVELVREMAHRFGLDSDASRRLEQAMVQREEMGKDVKQDIEELTVHLENSNKPSALVSMKLASLRAGDPIGACAHARKKDKPGAKRRGGRSRSRSDRRGRRRDASDSREPPKPQRRGKKEHKTLVMHSGGQVSDEALSRKFDTSRTSHGSEQLMDEATVLRLMARNRR